MPSERPSLALSTPKTANFPIDVMRDIPSAVSARTPLSALSRFGEPFPSAGLPSAGLPSAGPMSARVKLEEGLQKTPITPPLAYLDFLRSMNLASPNVAISPATGKAPLNRTSTASTTSTASSEDSAEGEQEKSDAAESLPSTAASEVTDCSCKCEHSHAPKEPMAAPTTTLPSYPLSAPATGPATFPSMKIPPSPARSNVGNTESPVRSPFSAKSVRSPFDWEAALKARRYNEVPGAKAVTSPNGKTVGARTSIRHIREVVTRTVTYTPRMEPAPKGKRRKVDHETAAAV